MRQSPLLKFISVVLLIAVLGYVGYNIYDRTANTVVTAVAYPYTVETSVETEGKIIREEQPITGGGDAEVIISDGEKVSAGQAVAVRYLSASSMERAATVTELQLKIEQIESVLRGAATDGASPAASSVIDLSSALQSGDYSSLSSALLGVETYVFSGGYGSYSEAELITELENTQQQLIMLLAASSDDAIYLYTSSPGIFSSVADGYESIHAETVMTLLPSSFNALFSIADEYGSQNLGKLVYDITWRYAAVMSDNDAQKLTVGKTATVRFSKTYSQTLAMTVDYISESEGGKRLVIFSCNRYMSDVCSLRDMYGTVIFKTVTGLRVPKAAMHLDEDGKTCLYVVSGRVARLVNVTILGEIGDYYLIDATTGTLHSGEEVIVKANNLYDGRVVR